MTMCAWVTLYAGVGRNVLKDTNIVTLVSGRTAVAGDAYICTGDGRDLYRRSAGGR